MSKSIILAFEGFVQIRLATDPDPTDEPRGVSGWTFAVAEEPDLDRVLVLQDDDPRRVRRSHGPSVGVTVRQVLVDEQAVGNHPLMGTPVNLLDAPKFEGRNWIIADDGNEPIDPFHLRIGGKGPVLEKQDVLSADAGGAEIPLFRASPEVWRRRKPVGAAPAAEVLAAIGVKDPVQWRLERQEQLKKDLPGASTPTARCALEKRIRDLNIKGAAVGTVGYGMAYDFGMRGPGRISDPENVLNPTKLDAVSEWPIQFWVGGWDADALCAYLRGKVTIPFLP